MRCSFDHFLVCTISSHHCDQVFGRASSLTVLTHRRSHDTIPLGSLCPRSTPLHRCDAARRGRGKAKLIERVADACRLRVLKMCLLPVACQYHAQEKRIVAATSTGQMLQPQCLLNLYCIAQHHSFADNGSCQKIRRAPIIRVMVSWHPSFTSAVQPSLEPGP